MWSRFASPQLKCVHSHQSRRPAGGDIAQKTPPDVGSEVERSAFCCLCWRRMPTSQANEAVLVSLAREPRVSHPGKICLGTVSETTFPEQACGGSARKPKPPLGVLKRSGNIVKPTPTIYQMSMPGASDHVPQAF